MKPQPIETAPKDGEEILVYFQGIGWKSVTFKDITGTFAGTVAYNECGLIAYMPVSGRSHGGNVTIKG